MNIDKIIDEIRNERVELNKTDQKLFNQYNKGLIKAATILREQQVNGAEKSSETALNMQSVINSRLSELEEENRLLKLIIENGLGSEDLENDCL